MKLYQADFSQDPGIGTALSSVLLEQEAETFLLYRPGLEVLFSGQDKASPDFLDALGAAKQRNFLPLRRACGGRAVVFHPGCLAFTWTSFPEDPMGGIDDRFQEAAHWVRSALRGLGLDAETGELPGEYCPGEWSVHIEGKKVAGVAQRVAAPAAQVSVILTVSGAEASNGVLVPLYGALGLPLDPDRTGEVGLPEADVVAALQRSVPGLDSPSALPDNLLQEAKDRLPKIVL